MTPDLTRVIRATRVFLRRWRVEQCQILAGTTDLIASLAQFEHQRHKPLPIRR
jgi:hypothetical protein